MEPVSVALKVGVVPLTGLLLASINVMVTVEVVEPFATTGPDPLIEELAATADPAVKVTVPPDLLTGVRIESVFTSALVEESEQVEMPEESEAEQAP